MKSFIPLAYALVLEQNRGCFGSQPSWIDDIVRPFLNLIISLALFVPTACSAAVITFRGEDTAAQNWRNPAFPKPLSPGNNNIYGNDGYVMFDTAPANSIVNVGSSGIDPFTFSAPLLGLATLNVRPTYVSSFTPASTFTNVFGGAPAYLTMNNPAGGSMKSGVGYAPGNTTTFTNLFTFTVNSSVPSSFVVGLFFNNGAGQVLRAMITGPGGSGTGTVTMFNNIDAIFFTISNATSGNVFTVSGLGNPGFNGNLDLTGITFDSVPEPTTLGGCAAAALALIWFGRRGKNSRCQIAARLLDRDGLS
jgi:hypothetical protein